MTADATGATEDLAGRAAPAARALALRAVARRGCGPRCGVGVRADGEAVIYCGDDPEAVYDAFCDLHHPYPEHRLTLDAPMSAENLASDDALAEAFRRSGQRLHPAGSIMAP